MVGLAVFEAVHGPSDPVQHKITTGPFVIELSPEEVSSFEQVPLHVRLAYAPRCPGVSVSPWFGGGGCAFGTSFWCAF